MQHRPISLVFAYGIDGEKRGLEGFPLLRETLREQRAILNPEGQGTNYNTRKIGDSDARTELTQRLHT
ncbi:MAG: hypothetical protein V7K48_04750 [Nostoc sp.]|uniref:hypothetical protein n=1 Tax=Nostoc sp. TaxID=1180 RepID=UPI002FFAA663